MHLHSIKFKKKKKEGGVIRDKSGSPNYDQDISDTP
jgi:hypothetical protein